ncbi:MAG: hypothetical protein GOV15_04725 [Candidatus Diapherotrites archaeon]|nr:hypothetical protein [Candidatus Diapherotrites archaeon]
MSEKLFVEGKNYGRWKTDFEKQHSDMQRLLSPPNLVPDDPGAVYAELKSGLVKLKQQHETLSKLGSDLARISEGKRAIVESEGVDRFEAILYWEKLLEKVEAGDFKA